MAGIATCLTMVGCGTGLDLTLEGPASATPAPAVVFGGGGGPASLASPVPHTAECPVDALARLSRGVEGISDPIARGILEGDLRGMNEAAGGSETLRRGQLAQMLADLDSLARSGAIAAERAAHLRVLATCWRP